MNDKTDKEERNMTTHDIILRLKKLDVARNEYLRLMKALREGSERYLQLGILQGGGSSPVFSLSTMDQVVGEHDTLAFAVSGALSAVVTAIDRAVEESDRSVVALAHGG